MYYTTETNKPKKTESQIKKQRKWEYKPDWTVRRRIMNSDGLLHLVCSTGKVVVDVRIGRGGAETVTLRNPWSLTRPETIASLITARSEGVQGA